MASFSAVNPTPISNPNPPVRGPLVAPRASRALALCVSLAALMASGGGCGGGGQTYGAEPGPALAAKDSSVQPSAPPAAEQLDDAALAKLYEETKAAVESGKLDGAEAALGKISQQAKDPHLRANASLFLGALAEAKEDWLSAVSHYKQARAAVPQEPSTHAVLALALAKLERYSDAVPVQETLVEMTPDDLQAWLILGELRYKAGDEKGATEAYAGYEMRRKGLLDGLTLKKDSEYVVNSEERVVIAQNLAPASDNGTALALLYALDSDPDARVGDAIAEVMGIQRLAGYRGGLEARQQKELDEDSKKITDWALSEIARDPLDVRPGSAPWLPEAGSEKKDAPSAPAESAPAEPATG